MTAHPETHKRSSLHTHTKCFQASGPRRADFRVSGAVALEVAGGRSSRFVEKGVPEGAAGVHADGEGAEVEDGAGEEGEGAGGEEAEIERAVGGAPSCQKGRRREEIEVYFLFALLRHLGVHSSAVSFSISCFHKAAKWLTSRAPVALVARVPLFPVFREKYGADHFDEGWFDEKILFGARQV